MIVTPDSFIVVVCASIDERERDGEREERERERVVCLCVSATVIPYMYATLSPLLS